MPTLIHCTQKLLAEIPDRLIDPSASGESWHANLLRIDRRKCVLFTHDATLYSVRFHIGLHVEDDGGLTSVDLGQLHHRLNRIPFSAVGYGYPVERLREYLAA